MPDIRQSPSYAQFILKIGWLVENIDGVNIFIKKLPLLPALIKIQRPNKLPEGNKLKLLMQKYYTRSISVEPSISFQLSAFNYQQLRNPYLPTKTIHINLIRTEEEIFNSFSEAKRRGIRKAQKNSVQIVKSDNIDDFIKLKNKSAGFLGFLTTRTVKPLWQTFFPKNAFCLLAKKNVRDYSSNPDEVAGEKLTMISSRPDSHRDSNNNIIAGVLVLIWQKTAYYWMAASTKKGNRCHVPTLLVWEALKESKKRGATVFDFEGIYDEQYLKLNKEWLGFTKFKQGFGGREIYFPKPFVLKN